MNETISEKPDLNVTVATRWELETAEPISNVQMVMTVARGRYGIQFSKMVLSRKSLFDMAKTKAFKLYASMVAITRDNHMSCEACNKSLDAAGFCPDCDYILAVIWRVLGGIKVELDYRLQGIVQLHSQDAGGVVATLRI